MLQGGTERGQWHHAQVKPSNRCSLPEVDVRVVEDVGVHVEIVEALRRQHHAHIVAAVEQRQCLQVERRRAHLAQRGS